MQSESEPVVLDFQGICNTSIIDSGVYSISTFHRFKIEPGRHHTLVVVSKDISSEGRTAIVQLNLARSVLRVAENILPALQIHF